LGQQHGGDGKKREGIGTVEGGGKPGGAIEGNLGAVVGREAFQRRRQRVVAGEQSLKVGSSVRPAFGVEMLNGSLAAGRWRRRAGDGKR
jgi:hypothetical protein